MVALEAGMRAPQGAEAEKYPLSADQTPTVWVLQYATYVLFGRSVRHRVGRFYRPPIPVHQGIDMGRAVSVLLFCVAMDPIYVVLNAIPGVLSVKGYMDDNATCGTDGRWLSTAQLAFSRFSGPGTSQVH